MRGDKWSITFIKSKDNKVLIKFSSGHFHFSRVLQRKINIFRIIIKLFEISYFKIPIQKIEKFK
jgi:hypothetical protein